MVDPKLLAQAADAAKGCELETHLPAALTLAQWALESGWGQHQPGNNCFGIKAYEGCYAIQSLRTSENISGKTCSVYQPFARFVSIQDCFEKHAELITQGASYRLPWGAYLAHGNPYDLAQSVAAVYATDPDYASKLTELMRSEEITKALA